MRFEATVAEIQALLRLAALEAQGQQASHETRSEGELRGALLERYETLLAAGRRPAIVAIERSRCTGCHVRLPTMLESLARRAPVLHTCPHCLRLIYAPELLIPGGLHVASGGEGRKAGPARRDATASASAAVGRRRRARQPAPSATRRP